MSAKILTYKQFSSIVPKKTREFVDNFLIKLGCLNSLLSEDYLESIKSKCLYDLFVYMYQSYDSPISNILHNKYDIKSLKDYYILNSKESKNVSIEDTFNILNEMFCVLEYTSEYYYLVPETIIFNNLKRINKNWTNIECKNYSEILRGIYANSDILSELRAEKELSVNSEKLKFENDTFANLSPETILYLKKANKICKIIIKEKYNRFDVCALSLLLTFYKISSLEPIRDFLRTVNIDSISDIRRILDKIDFDIYIPDFGSIDGSSYDIGELFILFGPYIDNLKKIENDTPKDIIGMLFNRSISNSFICEQIFRYNNPELDLTKITDEIDNYMKNRKDSEIDIIYKNLPIKTCKYFEFVSKIVYILKQKNENMNFNIHYSELEIIDIAIFISSFYRDNEIISYFSKNNITFDEILNYLNLSKEDLKLDIEKDKCNIKEIYDWFKKYNYAKEISIRNIILYTLDKKSVSKILSDLCGSNIHDKRTVEKFIENDKEQKRIELLSKFYGDLEIDIVKILESSYIYYKYLLNCSKYYDLTDDDLLQIALLVTIYKLYSNDLSKYIYDELFSSTLLSDLIGTSSAYIESKQNIFDEEIDAKDFCNHFGKYIFGGKNKDIQKKNIKIDDILNNLFNINLNYSIEMKNFLNEFNLTYDDFDNIREKYRKYSYKKLLEKKDEIKTNVLNSINSKIFEIIDDIDKIIRLYGLRTDISTESLILIYMYYRENNLCKYLIDEGITLDKLFDYFNITKEEFDKFEELETDYEHINDYFVLTGYNYRYNDFLSKSNFDEIIKLIFKSDDDILKNTIKDLGGDLKIIEYEIENGEKYIPPLTREEKLDEYLNMPIPKIEIKDVEEISNFGLELSNQSEFISQTFNEFIDGYNDESANITSLQEDFNGIYKEKTKGRKLRFFSKKVEGNYSTTKKEMLDRLDNYLRNKEKSLGDGLKELQYIKSLIAAYLKKAEEYLKECENAKERLTLEINNKQYYENDFRVFDDNLKMQLLDDKISSMNMSILQMIQQYQRITMQMGTHATLMNQVNLARSSTIQNLYIELSLREEIEKEKDSISSLNTLIELLGNMSNMNSDEMISNINKINKLNKCEEIVITDKDKVLINQILDEQNTLKPNDNN